MARRNAVIQPENSGIFYNRRILDKFSQPNGPTKGLPEFPDWWGSIPDMTAGDANTLGGQSALTKYRAFSTWVFRLP